MKRLLVACMVLASAPAFADGRIWAEARAGARVSLAVDGPWVGALADQRAIEILDPRTARPQLIESSNGVDLLLYIDPTAFATCALDGAVLAPTANGIAAFDGKRAGMNVP